MVPPSPLLGRLQLDQIIDTRSPTATRLRILANGFPGHATVRVERPHAFAESARLPIGFGCSLLPLLDGHGGCLAAADAERGDAASFAVFLHRCEQRHED